MTTTDDRLGRLLHGVADHHQLAPDGMEKIERRVEARRRARRRRRGALLAGAVGAVAAVGITVPVVVSGQSHSTGRVRTIAPASPGPSSRTTPPSTSPSTSPPATTPPTASPTTIVPPTTLPATPVSRASSPPTALPSTTTTAPSAAILAPAEVPPVAGVVECNLPVTHTEDGNVKPLGCPYSGINVAAWNFYVPLAPHLLSLGQNATLVQVTTAACSDVAAHVTFPEATYAAQLAGTYYGWPESYGQSVSSELPQGVCDGSS